VTAVLRPAPSEPTPVSSVAARAVVWHPQRLLGQALVEGLRDGGAISRGRVETDLDGALAGALSGADVVLVAQEAVQNDLGELTEALRHRGRTIPVLVLRWDLNADGMAAELQSGARGVIALQDGAAEARQSIIAALQGDVALPRAIQSAALGSLRRAAQRRRDAQETLELLTPKERVVLELLADGNGCRVIAGRMGVSVNTVRTYLQRLRTKLDARTQLQLAAVGRELLAIDRLSAGDSGLEATGGLRATG
jgi:DNA-binding NarL/FixJ family response regulator